MVADAVIARKKEVVDLKNEIRDHPNLPGWKLSLVWSFWSIIDRYIYIYIYIYIQSFFEIYYRNLCTSSQTFDLGLEQYLVLTEDEEVQEEENLMTDMFRCKDGGSNDGSTSSDETDSSSQPNKKKKKTTGKKGKKSKASKKKTTKKQKKSKKSKKTKKNDDDSEDPEKAKIADLEKKIRKATGGYITSKIIYVTKPSKSHGYDFPCWQAIADVTKKIKNCNVELTKSANWCDPQMLIPFSHILIDDFLS